MVGAVETTNVVPVPVCDAIAVAFPDEVITPVKLALVVTLLEVKAVAVPVMFVPTNADGVPRAGVTSVGLVERTLLPEPVDDVTPVPPLATTSVPATETAPPVAADGVRPVVPKAIVVMFAEAASSVVTPPLLL